MSTLCFITVHSTNFLNTDSDQLICSYLSLWTILVYILKIVRVRVMLSWKMCTNPLRQRVQHSKCLYLAWTNDSMMAYMPYISSRVTPRVRSGSTFISYYHYELIPFLRRWFHSCPAHSLSQDGLRWSTYFIAPLSVLDPLCFVPDNWPL